MCFVLASVFSALVSSLTLVFLVAQLFVIARLLRVCYNILLLVLCAFLCVGTLSGWDSVSLIFSTVYLFLCCVSNYVVACS